LIQLFNKFGKVGVEAIKHDIEKVSATHETEQSIRYETKQSKAITSLKFIGRKFLSTLETGRGPRQSSKDSNFKDSMLKYMKARGIGSDLNEKQKKNLARFLVLKINKEGDSVYKKGGRVVYSKTLERISDELSIAAKEELITDYTKKILDGFKHT